MAIHHQAIKKIPALSWKGLGLETMYSGWGHARRPEMPSRSRSRGISPLARAVRINIPPTPLVVEFPSPLISAQFLLILRLI